jgi:hypothetical protein
MSAAVLTRLDDFLTGRGWSTTRLTPETVRTSFKGAKGTNFPLVCSVEDGWAKLTVVPMARLPSDVHKAEKLYLQLLRLNGELMFARFSLDEDGDVLLSVEFPVEDLDDSEIGDALDVLTFYADKYGADVRATVA